METERWVCEGGDPCPPELQNLGYDHLRSALWNGAHQHEGAFEFIVTEQGHTNWEVPEGTCEAFTGDVFHTKPGEIHKGCYDAIEPCRRWWLQVRVPATQASGSQRWLELPDDEGHALLLRLYQLPRVFRGDPQLFTHLRSLRANAGASGPVARAACRWALVGFLLCLLRPAESRRVDPDILPGLRDIVLEMQLNKAWRPRVEELASRVGVSQSHFHRVFREYTGLSPIEYGERLRMQEACARLEKSRCSIIRIANDLGYATSQHFSAVFKRTMGQSPVQWRKHHELSPARSVTDHRLAVGAQPRERFGGN
ncbi:MAG: AraC family transcriptional regulator [Firmicutes bacterium]|nr:AraC family transcriptional regulator [Bacillota bacterium]